MINIDRIDDAELSAVFAVEVAGWEPMTEARPCHKWMVDGSTLNSEAVFATSMDAVLPYLERTLFRIERLCQPDEYCVYIELPAGTYVKGCDVRLSKATCIALILAARAEKKASQ
jgi:hypothetical protein